MEPTPLSALLQDSGFSGAYEIAGELGRGGFGQVYRARQRSTGREVAIKIAQIVDDEVVDAANRRRDRFRRELALCAELSHPNIVRLIDSGEASDGTLYAVFEQVVGTTLKDVLATEGRLEPREAARLLGQVLDALSCAHARGIVHRDVTPSNIMVTKPGARRNALVLDFGLGGFDPGATLRSQARITATRELLGTPCYASPEQLRGEPPSPASDLYSWGLVLLECLTGEIPFQGASAQEVIFQQLGPDPVAIPRWLRGQLLAQLIERVCAKRVDVRLVDVAEILSGLEEVALPGGAARSLPKDAPPAERERRQLTVSCYRLSVTPAANHEVDVEEIDEVIRAQQAALATLASTAGGAAVTVSADRIFMVHGYPQAREGDARRAARTALEFIDRRARETKMQSQKLLHWGMHVGLHTGLVIVPDPTRSSGPQPLELTGLTAQIASRLADLAGEDEILVSSETSRLVRADFNCAAAGECSMSELSRPFPIFRIAAGLQQALEVEQSVRRTPLVGRQRELDRLLAGWHAAERGEPSAVVLSGEAGIGKSRLVRELFQHVGAENWMAWQCTAESQTAPLRPVVDALAALPEPLETFLARLELSVEEQALISALIVGPSLQPDPTRIDVSPDRQKALTIEAILTATFRLAERQPVVLAVENLHWADPTTLELLRMLTFELGAYRGGRAGEGPRLFVVLTTRPEAVPAWGDESLAFLPLQRLAPDEVTAMVRALLADREPSTELIDAVVQRGEGVPLFVEEIARLADEAERRLSGDPTSSRARTHAEVPSSLRDLLTARLDGVSPSARETARVASALGREFGYDLLQAVSSHDDVQLRSDVTELAQAGLVFPRRTGGGQRCVFRHALLQDATYEALTRSTRETLHRRVAEVLRARFADVAQGRPELLALHHERGGELQAAAGTWLLAGVRSYRAAAYVESLSQLERGLAALRDLGSGAAHRSLEVDLLVTYGTSLLSTRGWADPQVEATFNRAIAIAEADGGEAPLMAVYGLWGVLITTSNRAGVDSFLVRMERLRAKAKDRHERHFSSSILGIAAAWRGDIREAATLLADSLESYDEEAAYAGYDGGIYSYAFQFCGLWSEGYPDRAHRVLEDAFALARRRRDPYSVGAVLAFGTVLALCRGDADAAIAYGQELMTLANDQRLHAFWPAGSCAYGAGLALNGRPEEGLRFLVEGLDRYRLFGIMGSYSTHQVYLAEVYLQLGRTDDALAAIERGLALCETQYARFHESELLRLRGEVLLHLEQVAEAQEPLRRAVDLCDTSGNRGMGLRAASTLATALRRAGRPDQAREVLAPRYAFFTEGFTTRDLRRAKAILDELAAV